MSKSRRTSDSSSLNVPRRGQAAASAGSPGSSGSPSSARELKLTAALYASRPGVMKHLRTTGRLPDEIRMPGAEIGLRLLIESRGTDISLTDDERLVFEAILREGRLPGGNAVLVDGRGS